MRTLGRYIVIRSQQAENRYGVFCGEILRSEGLMGFEIIDLDAAAFPELGLGDLLVLTRCFLSADHIDHLLAGAARGAGVVVLQPQDLLTRQLGLEPEPGIILPGYIRVVDHPIGPDVTLQTHVPIPIISIPRSGRCNVVAEAISREQADAGRPAVVRCQVGEGTVVLFFYDLAEAVARIRFGNHDLASYRTLQWTWPHMSDMYAGHVDLDLAHLPQADIHGQLLADVCVDLCRAPLARLWYYERSDHRTACVFQSDGDLSEPEAFDQLASAVEERGGHITFYLMQNTKLSEERVRQLRDRGHTFAPHVDPLSQGGELYFAIPEALADETESFKERFGACSPTLQCHCAPWMGYMELVPLHVELGYRLLFAPLSIPATLWSRYMCGSGRPMKFYDRHGVLHDCWHQPVPFFDDEVLAIRLGKGSDSAYEEIEERIEASLNDTHTPIPILSHPASFCEYSAPVFERCLDRFHREGVPIYNADEWCAFHDRRSAVTMDQEWDGVGNTRVVVSGPVRRIPVMIPLGSAGEAIPTVRVDGRDAEAVVYERLGRKWLFVEVEGRDEHETVHVDVSGIGTDE